MTTRERDRLIASGELVGYCQHSLQKACGEAAMQAAGIIKQDYDGDLLKAFLEVKRHMEMKKELTGGYPVLPEPADAILMMTVAAFQPKQ